MHTKSGEIFIPSVKPLEQVARDLEATIEFLEREVDLISEGDWLYSHKRYKKTEKAMADKKYQSLKREADDIARSLVFSSIVGLAEFLQLDNSFFANLPSVYTQNRFEFVLQTRSWMCAYNDGDPLPISPPQNSCFMPQGESTYNYSAGPNIIIDIHSPDLTRPILEESIHFLEWEYQREKIPRSEGVIEIMRAIRRQKRYNRPCDDFISYYENSAERQFLPAMLDIQAPELRAELFYDPKRPQSTFPEIVTLLINYEAVAEAIRTIIGYPTENQLIADILKQSDSISSEEKMLIRTSLGTLLTQGTEAMYAHIENTRNKSLKEFLEEQGPFWFAIPRNTDKILFHFVGYSLGHRIADKLQTPADLHEFTKIVFTTTPPIEKLDHLVNLYK